MFSIDVCIVCSLHFKHLFHYRENLKTVLECWIYWKVMLFPWRERQLKLEKVRATQQHIEEFKRQQAEWRRMEHERMEAENRRIVEFASHQKHMEETRMAKIREREEAKENLHKIVETPFFFKCSYFYLFIEWLMPVFGTRNHSSLFSSSCLRRSKRRGSSVTRWSESARNFI